MLTEAAAMEYSMVTTLETELTKAYSVGDENEAEKQRGVTDSEACTHRDGRAKDTVKAAVKHAHRQQQPGSLSTPAIGTSETASSCNQPSS